MPRFDFMRLDMRPWGNPGETNLWPTYLNTEEVYVAWYFQPPENVSITHLGLLVDWVHGTPPWYKICLRSVGTDGLPGTYLRTKLFRPDSTWADKFNWVALDASFNARRGDKLFISVEWASGYVSSGNSIAVTKCVNCNENRTCLPYGVESGERFKYQPVYGYKSSSRSYGFPIKAVHTDPINSPAEVGLRFSLSTGFGKTYKVAGALWTGAASQDAYKNVSMILYDGSNNVLDRINWNCNLCGGIGTERETSEWIFDDASFATLTFGREYFLAFAPQETDTKFYLWDWEVEETGDMTALPGASNFYLVKRTTSSESWTRYRTRRPQMDLVIDDWSV
jgi:hypothetical protein